MISPSELAAIRARAEAATPGPWHAAQSLHKEAETNRWVRHGDNGRIAHVDGGWGEAAQKIGRANTYFIAEARTDIPRLLTDAAECRALIAEMAADVRMALSHIHNLPRSASADKAATALEKVLALPSEPRTLTWEEDVCTNCDHAYSLHRYDAHGCTFRAHGNALECSCEEFVSRPPDEGER
jgi:hypothetical protein